MSYTLKLGQSAPDFHLLATDHKQYALKDFAKAKGLVIFFTCNHCPYVIGSNENTAKLAKGYQDHGIDFVAINSNSPNTYKEDSFDHMIGVMAKEKFPWVYLHDQSQEIAKKYGALKTPHFFFFDQHRKLIYTGRAINHPRDHKQSTTHELQDAIDNFLKGEKIAVSLTNPIGCNIKWEGKPAHWMPPEACDLV